ncbi:MAG: cobalt ECF transporter T component CbiQ, partial [Desulfocucumaceae bacterium]
WLLLFLAYVRIIGTGVLAMCTSAHSEHIHHENFPAEKSLSGVDPRVKIVAIFGFVAVVSSLASIPLLALASAMIACLALVAGISPGHLLRRIALVLPFTGFVLVFIPFAVPGEAVFTLQAGFFTLSATDQGLDRAAILSLRVLGAVLAVNLLTSTTSINNLMKALRDLKIPVIFVQVLEFTVRYIYVLAAEVKRMRVARKSRCFQAGKGLFDMYTFRTLGQLVGTLFARSWDRGERIYSAMLSRGYSGETGSEAAIARPGWADICWGMGILAAAAGLRIFESGPFWGVF